MDYNFLSSIGVNPDNINPKNIRLYGNNAGMLQEGHNTIDDLIEIQKIIDAEKSDIFDVLEFVAFAKKPITRAERIEKSEEVMEKEFSSDQLDFINFVLGQYKEEGVIVLDDEKLPTLLELKYKSIQNAKQILGDLNDARNIFLDFQKTLYKV